MNRLTENLSTQFMSMGSSPSEMAADFERATGLDVSDVEALGGESVSLSAGSGFDPEQLFEAPDQGRIAARIAGDPVRIEASRAKIREALPADSAKLLSSRRAGDDVVVGPDTAYLDELAAGGDLGDTARFEDVVPDAGEATSVFFVNFDADDWLVELMGSDAERADAAPLEALGLQLTATATASERWSG